MTERILLIPAMVVIVQMVSVFFSRRYKSKKQARSELMMAAFLGIIIVIVIYGISQRMG